MDEMYLSESLIEIIVDEGCYYVIASLAGSSTKVSISEVAKEVVEPLLKRKARNKDRCWFIASLTSTQPVSSLLSALHES